MKTRLKKLHKKEARRDMFILCLLPVLAAIISLATNINFLTSTILFFAVPAAYLSYRTPHAVKRSLVYSLVVTAGLAFVEYYAEFTKT